MVHFHIVDAHSLERWRLCGHLRRVNRLKRQIFLQVGFGIAWNRIVGRMGAGEADLQKERRFGHGLQVDPAAGKVAHKHVGVRVLRQFPLERAQPLGVVGQLSVELALLLDQTARLQGFVPFVKVVASFQIAILVLHHIALVEAHGRIVGPGVHLAHVDAVVAAFRQLLHPPMPPTVCVAQNAGRMGVVAGEETRPRGRAGSRRDVALTERHALMHEPVQIGRLHVGKAHARRSCHSAAGR